MTGPTGKIGQEEKNRRPCLELIFLNFQSKNSSNRFDIPLVDKFFLITLTGLLDLPVKYGRKQLRKANTRTTLGPESPILN